MDICLVNFVAQIITFKQHEKVINWGKLCFNPPLSLESDYAPKHQIIGRSYLYLHVIKGVQIQQSSNIYPTTDKV